MPIHAPQQVSSQQLFDEAMRIRLDDRPLVLRLQASPLEKAAQLGALEQPLVRPVLAEQVDLSASPRCRSSAETRREEAQPPDLE
jgi:hypothetical protein